MTKMKAACVQVNASSDMDENIATACEMVRKAAHEDGANLICLPENVAMMEFGGQNVIAKSFVQSEHPALKAFRDLALETKAWLLIGSLAIKLKNGKVANRSFLLNDQGEITGQYDKIHLFDVDLAGGESYRESNTFDGGDKAVLAETPWGGLGMTICYDVRFPHLYRAYGQKGAAIMTVPAAFTKQTGEAHWKVLLRARAIENGCFIIAPGQCGSHKGERETYGHSLIIDPWGTVLAEGGDEPCVLSAELDMTMVEATRAKVPSLQHDRDYSF
ncbi:Carbon-nitrogen hydrolase [Candidatus Terasakiella magnetica]|uniref:Carbon-nitrogen hydrolase n=1 Tax=Candidatus Terasakiella magnetica TaxID=1867952 RepID=A0A1C3RJC4_9PROT|nr:carbon-nitrogen hydrolase family protein [Candidatus Terasakiella magnetica]SCA57382.1 Carbon-nitrogen hydrolase [Candidatus Terasakiella magnetica]